MRTVLTLSLIGVLATAADAAGPEATFLGQRTYAAAADCPKFKRTAQVGAAATRAIEPLPKTLSSKGYSGPDGSCRFTNIDERYTGRLWTVSMACATGTGVASAGAPAREELRSQVWRKQPDGSFVITEVRDATTWMACAPDKPSALPGARP